MNIKEQVIEAKNQGLSYKEISNIYGIPRSTAFDWVKAAGTSDASTVVGVVNTNLKREKDVKFDKTADNVLEFLEQLAPIEVQPSSNSIISSSVNNGYAMVIGDMHFPKQCDKTISIFLQVVEKLQPETIILNGDTVDLLAVSRYPKDIRSQYNLLEERIAYHKFLDSLLAIVPEETQIIEVNANHSGNDVTGRWWRYLSERIGELAVLPEIRNVLSYESVFLGNYKDRVSLVDYVNITDDFVILHGDVVRKNGGYSARGMLDKLNISLMHNHTHRIGSTAQRIPGIGKRKDKQIFAWENGCACDLNPVYASSPNWQNGFSIIGLDSNCTDRPYSVEQVMVLDGVAHVSTLGETIIAI
jgi:hypothetical protein